VSKSIILSLVAIIILGGLGFLIFKSSKTIIDNPIPTPGRIAAGYIVGKVTIGPFCPVEIAGHPCQVPPEAYTSRSVIVYDSNGTSINEKGNLDAQGNYKVAVGPGKYFVQISPAGIGAGEKKPATVKSFETTVVDFNIDTGIR